MSIKKEYRIEEKVEIVRQRMFHEITFDAALSKFDIRRATLSCWMGKYRSEVLRRITQEELSLYVLRNNKGRNMSVEHELRDRVAELEQELLKAKVERKVYETICDLAKSELNYDIKKT